MIRNASFGLIVALGGLLSGCATPTSPALERASAEHADAAADAAVSQNAPVALREAQKRLDEAAEVLRDEKDQARVEHLAYLAERHVEIARALARQRVAEAEVQKLSKEREQVRLEARTRQVDVALVEAERARMRADEQAATARTEADRAAKLQAELSELQARQTERGIVLTLSDVLFDFNRAELRPGAQQNLARLVRFLQEHQDREVLIEGHTDAIGSGEYNLELSRRRAEVVRSYLVESQIPPSRLTASGLGEAFPVASNEVAEGRQVNRRVEVVILDPGERAAAHIRSPAPVGKGP